MATILQDIRNLLIGSTDDDTFDTDLIILINSAFGTLNQIGVGPTEGFSISEGGDELWEDFTDDELLLTKIKPYI